jgi:hypothetical protein
MGIRNVLNKKQVENTQAALDAKMDFSETRDVSSEEFVKLANSGYYSIYKMLTPEARTIMKESILNDEELTVEEFKQRMNERFGKDVSDSDYIPLPNFDDDSESKESFVKDVPLVSLEKLHDSKKVVDGVVKSGSTPFAGQYTILKDSEVDRATGVSEIGLVKVGVLEDRREMTERNLKDSKIGRVSDVLSGIGQGSDNEDAKDSSDFDF